VALAAILTIAPAFAQLDRGCFTGAVTDSSSAVVPRVTVAIRNANTGAVYETTTTQSGQYTMPNLPIGTYDLTLKEEYIRELANSLHNLSVTVSSVIVPGAGR
jgi:hypothetical protein